ncbi:tol-pal system protein YbgF [Pseudoxanthomonas suwonensis]|uniref:tol-pal system protein YbgF n=1 Tax=Pseudoxanthomonas suwonensis TaxID=314722 RepID=UPI003CCD803D|nr:tol-pal system protein YbgF [Pseudoxanthomonas suwonensis]
MLHLRAIGMMLVVAALVAATPAHAQKMSLADRVARLEVQANNTQANQDLLNQLALLRSEVQELRSALEQLQHEHQQLQQRNRDQYLDLDGRLNRLEGGELPAPPAATGAAALAPPAPKAPAAPADAQPRVHGDPGSLALGADERAAYEAAFNTLKAGEYDRSAEAFQAFLDAYPAGDYAPNALYWLGESYYATGNYALAGQQFRGLIERYPTHDKAPGALLKLGLAQFGEGEVRQAQATLAQVESQYPGTDAARIAADRLRSIQLSQLR